MAIATAITLGVAVVATIAFAAIKTHRGVLRDRQPWRLSPGGLGAQIPGVFTLATQADAGFNVERSQSGPRRRAERTQARAARCGPSERSAWVARCSGHSSMKRLGPGSLPYWDRSVWPAKAGHRHLSASILDDPAA